ncbi:hypothetical protein B0H19DRAFT_1382740 [Mycena capillaripes]|nr:hypothetical protein B0H19DRAFT_1382740 [Mycena capillaripes]
METFAMYTLSEIFTDMDTTNKLGLLNGTLYEVLQTSYVGEDASVAAIVFNITCGYLPQPRTSWNKNGTWHFVFPSPIPSVSLTARAPRMIGVAAMAEVEPNTRITNSVTMYTTIPIRDSSLQTISSVELDPPMLTAWNAKEPVSTVQFFQFSQSLVHQTATVGAQSRQASAVESGIGNQNSVWLPYSGPVPGNVNGNMVDMWARWLNSAPGLEVLYYPSEKSVSLDHFSITFSESFLMRYFNLIPEGTQTRRTPRTLQMQEPSTSLTLHDVENALSSMIAFMFWMLGHSPPVDSLGVTNHTLTHAPLDAPYLLEGNATVYEYVVETRLHLSIIVVIIGLLAYTSLTALSVSYCKDQIGSNVPLAGFGFLHTIWLFHNHPDLDVVLPRVDDPTDRNLREAGMIPIKLGESVGVEPDFDYGKSSCGRSNKAPSLSGGTIL